MALKGLRVSEQYPYVSKLDDCYDPDIEKAKEKGATVFMIGTLRADRRTAIQDGVMSTDVGGLAAGGGGTFRMNTARQNLEACRFGLRGWENFKDADGKDLPFEVEKKIAEGNEYACPTMETLSYLTTAIVNDLGREILSGNSVTVGEAKNSKPQS